MKPTHKRYRKMQSFFENLPQGRTYGEVAEKLGEPINTATRWGKIFGYSFVDGRFRSGRKRRATTRIPPRRMYARAARLQFTRSEKDLLLGLTNTGLFGTLGALHIKR
ncbi:MAG TPA: hypothetical protein DEF00_04795 [Candidatus Taylorbacteria bacterium]|nr:hypothetical protein [Candidatus Taylorbacteria bacterium]